MKRRKQPRENKRNNEDTKRVVKRETEQDNNKDMLSDLPDCVLLHIISFLNVENAVQTCLLSTRWKRLWKHLPTFKLSDYDFNNRKGKSFTNFVNTFLSLRDSSTELNSLDFKCQDLDEPQLLNRIVAYAVSHNVNRLRLVCPINHFPPSLFSCPSLTSLALQCPFIYAIFPNSLNLPALTYLKLNNLSFCSGNDGCAEPFSRFNRLNSLIISDCMVLDGKTLCITSTALVDLCLYPICVAEDYSKIDLYAPNLCTFAFNGTPFQNLRGSNLSSLKHLNIGFDNAHSNPLILLNLLIELAHIESLAISVLTLEALKLGHFKSKVKFPCLCNLKLLKVKMIPYCLVPKGAIDLLLQNAPFAKVCIDELRRQTRLTLR